MNKNPSGPAAPATPLFVRGEHITAADAGDALTVYGGNITASTITRTLGGPVVVYGRYGRTSRGKLKVRPGALRFPPELHRVKLTKEHNRDESRGHLVVLEDDGRQIRAALRVADGPEGDAALREATDRTRDGFSFDVVDATVEGDEIVDALVVAIGQVGIPAYDDTRIDTIAASSTPTPEGTNMLTPAQRARLAELRAIDTPTDEQARELEQLAALEAGDNAGEQAAGEPAGGATRPASPATPPAGESTPPAGGSEAGGSEVQASRFAAVPSGVPAPAATTRPRGGAVETFATAVAEALRPGGGGAQAITAALNDVTYSAHADVISPPAWSGELWSGLEYEPQFTDMFTPGTMTALKGNGFRFVSKLVMQDYAGDKVAIPTSTVTTEPTEWSGARMAVGVDVDRAFYDFPNAGFVRALAEQARESWAMKLDEKALAYLEANAVAAEGAVAQPTLLKAAAVAIRALKRRRVGRATHVLVNDDDLFTLMDVNNDAVSAFLDLFGVEPRNFRSSPDVAAGTVLASVRQGNKLRTLPGSPIRVSAQHIANGGVDEAFFGYYAFEEIHTAAIASATYTEPAA